jgi:hypothetical protein
MILSSVPSRECAILGRMTFHIKLCLPTAFLILLIACGTEKGADTPSHQAADAVRDGAHESVLPFIADDYATALAEARRRDVPIFVDNWAPW